MKKIDPSDLMAFKGFESLFPIKVDAVYADAAHPENAFGQVYHKHATLWGHRDLVKIVLLAARRLYAAHGWTLIIKDCLRPVEAQAFMVETPIVKANPHWIQEPRFLSSAGQGGHPRGMAVDLDASLNGAGVDFGTAFDHFAASTDKEHNPAHREYPYISENAKRNRIYLETAIAQAAQDFNLPMLALPQEWWDFRFPFSYTKDFVPLSDDDLFPHQKMICPSIGHYAQIDDNLLKEINFLFNSTKF